MPGKTRRDEHQRCDAHAIRCDGDLHREREGGRGRRRTFAGCKMKTAGTYTLTATDGTLTSVSEPRSE